MNTIITHFYNEEFLLPLWLNHHKKYFDFGVLIDYGSTDRSVEIIKQLCPNWQIIRSGNQYFDARSCDYEVQFIEKQLHGYRIALPVTEFLVGNVAKLLSYNTPRTQHKIPVIVFAGYDPNGKLDNTIPLWEQVKMGLPYDERPEQAWPCRSLHNFNDIEYHVGRHFYPHNTTDCMVFKYSSVLIGSEMINRRLQIQHKVSPNDKQEGIAEQHVYKKGNGLTLENIHHMYHETIGSANPIDCTKYLHELQLIKKPMSNYITSTIINNLPNIENLSYLELGVASGENYNSIMCKNKMSVDIMPGIAKFTGTTDEYFDQLSYNKRFDIIFIDANHDYDYVVRDFNNSINHADKWILLHDMIPAKESDAQRIYCSDGYKVLFHMLNYTNFEVYPMNNNHGLTLVKLPAHKIELNNETKNLSWHEFMHFMRDKKLYSTQEIEYLLQNS